MKKESNQKEDRPIPCTNEIRTFFHCANCAPFRPPGVSLREWAQLEVGFTTLGIQVWCKRCEKNVVHTDFEGQKHPANQFPDPATEKKWEDECKRRAGEQGFPE